MLKCVVFFYLMYYHHDWRFSACFKLIQQENTHHTNHGFIYDDLHFTYLIRDFNNSSLNMTEGI